MSSVAFPLAGRRVLVTGASGFVGSHLVEALLGAGARVRATLHRRPLAVAPDRVEVVEADLSERAEALKATAEVDAVVHAAGSVGSAGVAPSDVLLGIGGNLELLANVLWAAWRSGVGHALVFGSSTAYPPASRPVVEAELWTGAPHPAYLGYGWMRRYVEKLAEFVAEAARMRVVIVRPGALYGPRDHFDPARSQVVASLVRRAVEREDPFVIWGTGEDVRDLLHVGDFAAGSALALQRASSCDPVNVASGVGIRVRDLAREVLRAAEHDPEVRFAPERPVAIPYRVLDVSKAQSELGFSPRFGLAEGIAETVRWYRAFARR